MELRIVSQGPRPALMRVIMGFALFAAADLAQGGPAAAAPVETVIYSFMGSDGAFPAAGLIFDSKGALYGTTRNGGVNLNPTIGTVFKLTPPATGTQWKEAVLYAFTSSADGRFPEARLTFDASGSTLYGTTSEGGSSSSRGTVFKLTPPPAGKTLWTKTELYNFQGGSDGANPKAGLIRDSNGALYGTTSGYTSGRGTVFKLTPPATGTLWKETVLYSFDGTHGADPSGLVFDSAKSALYGTTYTGGANGTGTVFKLTPPATGTLWKETVLYSFLGVVSRIDGSNPSAGLTFDASGVLYGTTFGGGTGGKGTVFKLKP